MPGVYVSDLDGVVVSLYFAEIELDCLARLTEEQQQLETNRARLRSIRARVEAATALLDSIMTCRLDLDPNVAPRTTAQL